LAKFAVHGYGAEGPEAAAALVFEAGYFRGDFYLQVNFFDFGPHAAAVFDSREMYFTALA
jgi:hypothetical protein